MLDGNMLKRACTGCQARTLVNDTQSGVVSFDSTMYLGMQAAGKQRKT